MNPPTPELQEMIASAADAAVSGHFRDQCLIEFTAALLSADGGTGSSMNNAADRIIHQVGIITQKLVEFRRTTRVSRAAINRETVAAADAAHETQ